MFDTVMDWVRTTDYFAVCAKRLFDERQPSAPSRCTSFNRFCFMRGPDPELKSREKINPQQ
jgi:hypothetical protein